MGILLVDIIVIGLFSALILWDVTLVLDRTPRNTISERVRVYARRTYIVPLMCGVLCGHWFHPWGPGDWFNVPPIVTTLSLISAGLTAIIASSLTMSFKLYMFPILVFVGYVIGMTVWPV